MVEPKDEIKNNEIQRRTDRLIVRMIKVSEGGASAAVDFPFKLDIEDST